MRYLTDRKRAAGLGAAKSGVRHFWAMKLSSLALLILIPLFVIVFAPMPGESHEAVTRHFARPFPAIVTALTLVVGFRHFNGGAQVLIEDYLRGAARKWAIVLTTFLTWAAMATGLFAVARMAL